MNSPFRARLNDFAASTKGAATTQMPREQPFDFVLLTPMYGGGARSMRAAPGLQFDPHHPVRASGIKSQLRFWWRTVQQDAGTPACRTREFRLFGGIARNKEPIASRIQLRVVVNAASVRESITSFRYKVHGRSYRREGWKLPYADFALDVGTPVVGEDYEVMGPGTQFRLQVTADDESFRQLEPALRLFANVGGIGGRTRRGFGAVFCQELAAVNERELRDWFGPGVSRFFVGAFSHGMAIDLLKSFRQGPGFARASGAPRPGQSFWPEAASVRRAVAEDRRAIRYFDSVEGPEKGRYTWVKSDNPAKHRVTKPGVYLAPRAVFGLPIEMQFAGESVDGPVTYFDSKQQLMATITNKAGRYPSPLLIRPLRWKHDPAEAMATAFLRLRQAGPGKVELQWRMKERNAKVTPRAARLEVAEAARWQQTLDDPASRALQGQLGADSTGDAVDAFFGFLHSGQGRR